MRSAPWSIADVIDFEYLLSADRDADAELTSARDTRIFQAKIAPVLEAGRLGDRRALFRAWLAARRDEPREGLPGAQFAAGWRLLLTIGALAGVGAGAVATGALLRYEKLEPINVATYLGWTLGVQWLVLLLAAVFWALRRTLPELRELYPLQALLWGCEAALRRIPGEKRERLRAALSLLVHKRQIYGSLTVWPLVIVTQLFAVAFNASVLGAMLAHVGVVDTRFGWQTTWETVPEQVHRVVNAVATPWSWRLPSARPTLQQIAASRFAPGQHLDTIPAAATRAWWPFLFLAILCYGLLVRVALFFFAAERLRCSLRSAKFDHAEANALFRRLTGPLITPGPDRAGPQIPALDQPTARAGAGGKCFGLIAEDAELSQQQLAAYLRERYGWETEQCARAQIDHPAGNADALEALGKAAPSLASVVLATRSRRAPIKAIALFLQKVAETAGPKPELLVLLIGRKSGEGFAPVDHAEFQNWRNFNAINRLHLGIEKWNPS